ncbi:response regulator [Paenibacillus sp. BR2-3]|uniref:response regulator n=1 Tax=Paenibacillus sp. BR2-3 TaxID=3048494 RepID=UPI003977B3A1
MKKLLIVDDEKNIRQGLKIIIDREYPGIYEISNAANGAEALNQFRDQPADIIITDIRMPVMDGIALLEHLSAEKGAGQEPAAVIILSGFDDFEYAKSAIRYRVKDYLLKPIRRDELFEVLGRINEELAEQHASLRKLEQEAESLRRERRSRLLQQLLLQKESPIHSEMQDRGREWGEELEGLPIPFIIGLLSYHCSNGTRIKPGEVQELIERRTGLLKGFSEILIDWDGRLVLIGSSREAFVELSRQAEVKELGGLLIGISGAGREPGEIRSCYDEASRALQYTYLYPQINFIDYETVRENRLSFPPPDEDLRKLLNMLGTGREKEMRGLLAAIFQIEHLKRMDLSYLEGVGRLMNERVLDEVFRVHGEVSVEVLKLYRSVGNMYNFRHFHDYYRALENLLVSVNDYIIGVRSAHTEHAEMKEALAYIEGNYHRSLNMAMVSNHVSLNYSYFSEAFKAYTGESFVTYLKKVRIRHAKRLLSEGRSSRLEEVSEAVGFENSKHFSRVFKELEGISPGEYRAKALL